MPAALPSTRSAAQQLLAYFVAGLRVATLVQMTPSLVPALTGAEHPALTSLTWAVAETMLVTVAALTLVRRAPTGAGLAALDVAVAVLLLVVGIWSVPVELRTGTWVGFQLAYALCVACSLIGVRARRHWLPILVALAAAEAVYLLPTVREWTDVPSMLGNILTVLVLGPLAWFGAQEIVRIGTEADEARRAAAAAAKADEERRARLAIHNGTALMRLLVENGVDDSTGLRVQAEAELNRMRAYLTGAQPPPSTGEGTTLAAVVTAAGAEYDDLPITVVADLAQGVSLSRALADDLAAALRSLLLNVRMYARADRVVLHAEEHDEGGGWEVSLHDNGVGFDTDATSYGVGIRDLVVGQLARSGVTATIDSVPGVGTTATLTMPARETV